LQWDDAMNSFRLKGAACFRGHDGGKTAEFFCQL
jgi:hypothetical protein